MLLCEQDLGSGMRNVGLEFAVIGWQIIYVRLSIPCEHDFTPNKMETGRCENKTNLQTRIKLVKAKPTPTLSLHPGPSPKLITKLGIPLIWIRLRTPLYRQSIRQIRSPRISLKALVNPFKRHPSPLNLPSSTYCIFPLPSLLPQLKNSMFPLPSLFPQLKNSMVNSFGEIRAP